jgi:asparagine synthase (glutamine-hydrolysing)
MTGTGCLGAMLQLPVEGKTGSGCPNGWPATYGKCLFAKGNRAFSLIAHGTSYRTLRTDSVALLLRGRAVANLRLPDASDVANGIAQYYESTGELPVHHLEGAYTLVILDGKRGRVLLYRNLADNGFTYYTVGPDGFRFASNLADLLEAAAGTPQLNAAALPAYFLYRFVPGRETLFKDIYRLMPGEFISYDGHALCRLQKQTFADLRDRPLAAHDAVDALEQVMGRVLKEVSERLPGTANLLSGGVDSSFIQAMWNRACQRPGLQPPVSFAAEVDHPRTRMDADYALTAARALGVRHVRIPADEPYIHYLTETIAATAEPPNHAMTVYFGALARAMVERGHPTGLCGEGADSLFGTGWSDYIYKAKLLRRLLPWGLARRVVGGAATAVFGERARRHLRLAEHLDDLDFLEHPVNQIAVFADWPAVEACFGADALAAGAAYRRMLLPLYRVPDEPLEQVHACGFLGEAVDSASLWTTLFNKQGGDLVCPFLDSRVIRLALNIEPHCRFRYGRPKDLLKRALGRHLPPELVQRPKLGFGQPIFEWLAAGGQLRPWVDAIADYDFVDRQTLAAARAQPNWFLYSLLCFDIWHKLFITRSFTLPARDTHESEHLAPQDSVDLCAAMPSGEKQGAHRLKK